MTGDGPSRLLAGVAGLPAKIPKGENRDRVQALVDRIVALSGNPSPTAPFRPAEMDALPWEGFRDGVDIVWLFSDGDGSSAALLRYHPGATIPHHTHAGEEHIRVLAGSQSDERGNYPAGTTTMNRVGSSHSVASPDGCVVAILWEKPVVFS